MLHTRIRRMFIASLVVVATVLSAFALTRGPQAPVAHAAPRTDVVYANGQTFYMIGAQLITNPSPQMLAQSDALYILAFPENTSCAPNCSPVTLPSNYQPQCNPCFHPGLPAAFVYHDHVLTGAPGFGADGTALSNKGPWQIIVMMYTPKYAMSSTFQPIKSDEDLAAAEAAGDFLPIGHGSNPYEIPTGHVLICPLVSSHA